MKQRCLFKNIIISLSLLIPFPVLSGECETYLGLGVGKEYGNFKQRAFIQQGSPANTNIIDKNNFSGKGGALSIFAGLANTFCTGMKVLSNLYLAGEIHYSIRQNTYRLSNLERNRSQFSYTTYKLRQDFGISVLPGLSLSECSLFYVKLGYSNTQFISRTNDNSLQNLKKHRDGLRYGLGFRQLLDDCWGVRLEGSQTNYRKITMFRAIPDRNFIKKTNICPQIQKLELSVLYLF